MKIEKKHYPHARNTLAYRKIRNCIRSCKTKQQLESAKNLIKLYSNMFENPYYAGNLYIDYNTLFFNFKEQENAKRRR
jgi:hypothetical protein